MCRNYCGNITSEINMLLCVKFVMKYGDVVEESV